MMMVLFFILRYLLPVHLLRKLISKRNLVTIIYYHNPTRNVFRKHIQYLTKHYNIIRLSDFVQAYMQNNQESLPKNPLIITLDDGHKDNYDLLSSMEEYGVHATIYICSEITNTNKHFWFRHLEGDNSKGELKNVSNIKRKTLLKNMGFDEEKEYQDRHALSLNEINEMSGVADFQGHTMYHPILTKCNNDEAIKEIKLSKHNLEKLLSKPVEHFAYPNGSYGQREVELVIKSGYLSAVTIKSGFNSLNSNIFELKRIGISDNASINELIVKVTGGWHFIKKIFRKN